MVFRRLFFSGVLVLSITCSLLGQKNHTTEWKSGSKPNVFDQIETEANGAKGPSAAENAAQRRQRADRLASLRQELDAVIQAASNLQQRLQSTDANTTLSLELRNQGKQLEESARKIRKALNDL